MAYFRQRGENWCFTIDLPRDPVTNKRNQKLISEDDKGNPFKEERDARKYAEKMQDEIEKGRKFSSLPFKDFTDKHFDSKICKVSESTFEYQRDILDRFLLPPLGKRKIDKINDDVLDDLITKWQADDISNGQIRNIAVVLSKIFKYAHKKKFRLDNPMDLVTVPLYTPPPVKVWNTEQVQKFKEIAKSSQFYRNYVFALDSGMRLGEIQALTWDDIDMVNRTATVNKTLKWTKNSGLHVKTHPKTGNSRRTIELPLTTMTLLEEQKADQLPGVDIVFDNMGKHYYPTTVSREFPFVCKRFGLPVIRFHAMRHTHATLLLLPPKPVPVHVVALRLGDKVEQVMKTYAHVLPRSQEFAVEKWNEILAEKTDNLQSESLS